MLDACKTGVNPVEAARLHPAAAPCNQAIAAFNSSPQLAQRLGVTVEALQAATQELLGPLLHASEPQDALAAADLALAFHHDCRRGMPQGNASWNIAISTMLR